MSADEKEAPESQPAAGSPAAESAPAPESGVEESGSEPEAGTAEQPETPQDDLPPVQCQVEDLGALRRKLTITVPEERIVAKRNETLHNLSTKAQVPGFRIGRAPRRLIEKRFGGEMADDIKAAMIAQGVEQALKQTELKVLGEPELDIEKIQGIELPQSGPMTFDITLEVQPDFELPELEGIPVARPSGTVTDGDVEEELTRWRANAATLETVDEPARPDDVLTADLTFQPEGGEKHEHVGVAVPVRAQAIEGVPLEELGEKLTGAQPGQTVVVETTIPPGHPDEALRGKKATFTIAVKQVRRTRLPEVDQAFAGRFGFDDVAGLRSWLRDRLEAQVSQNQTREMRRHVRDYLLGRIELELPEGVLGRMQERALTRRANELMMQGVPRGDIEKHIDALAVHAGEEAARELKALFIMQRVAEKLDVEVSQQEVNALISQMAAYYNRRPDSLRADLERRGAMTALYQQILEQKALDRLLVDAKIQDAEPAPQADPPAAGQDSAPGDADTRG